MTAEASATFSQAIRSASWALHQSAEGSHFMRDLMEGTIDREVYARYVAQLYQVYAVLEQAADTMRDDPIAGPFMREELRRIPALEADLRYFYGDDWAAELVPTEGTRTYCDRLREVGSGWPGGLVAHHYTRYMGDLSGGQMIGRAVERTYELHDHLGARFYMFDEITDLNEFKNGYRARLDEAPWDADERQRIIDEVLLAYRLNTQLLAALE
jgi:heme oxygenase